MIQNTKLIYKGKLLEVFSKKIRLPNNYIASFEVIKHPGAALIIPFLNKDSLIMLRQFRPVVNTYLYELPAGTLDKNESLLSCAKREIIEEIGYSAKKITKLGEIYPVPGYSTEKIVIYKAQNLKRQERTPEKDEVLEIFIFNKNKIKKLFKSGKIIDAKTICALTLCGWL
ncbi:MAG: NUDIX hydrolase [Candidatus Omnitrophota bacterium]